MSAPAASRARVSSGPVVTPTAIADASIADWMSVTVSPT